MSFIFKPQHFSVMDTDEAGSEGVTEFPLMQHFRITIDYGRGRVLLEPYQEVKNTQNQGKRLVTPKLPGR